MFKSKFKTKLFFILIAAVIIPVLFLVLVQAYDNHNYNRLIMDRIKELEVQPNIAIFNYWIDDKKDNINIMKNVMGLYIESNGNDEGIIEYLNNILESDDDFLNVFYSSTNGDDFLAYGEEPVVDGRDRAWFKGAAVNGVYVSNPYIDAVTGEEVITISVAITSQSEKLLGVMGVDLRFQKIIDIFETILNDDISAMAIVDSNSEIIYLNGAPYFSDTGDWISTVPSYEIVDEEGNTYNIISQPLDEINGMLLVVVEKGSFWNSHFLMADISLFRTAAGLLILLLIMYFVVDYVNKPIKDLERALQDVVKGTDRVRFKYTQYDELNDLYNLFLKMDDYIKNSEKSIASLNEELKTRNASLTIKNEEYDKAYNDLMAFSEKLTVKEKEYENLVENISDMIWIINDEGKITYANTVLEEKLGYETSELILKDFSDISREFDGDGSRSLYSVLFNRDFDAIDISLVSKDGKETLSTSVSTSRIYKSGKLIAVQGISRDISSEREMYHEYNSMNKELLFINEINNQMTTSNDLDKILKIILVKMNALVGARVSSIRLLDDDNNLVLKAVEGIDANIPASHCPELNHSNIGYAIRHQMVLKISRKEDMVLSNAYLEELLEKGLKIVILPLIGSKKEGALTLISDYEIGDDKLGTLKSFSDSSSLAIEKALLFEKLKNNYLKTIEALIIAMETKAYNMDEHSYRISLISKTIAEKLYLDSEEIHEIYTAGLLHDIGKIGISDDILKKERLLTPEEERLYMSHCEIGRKILEPIGLSESVLDGVYLHHKRYDLTGYPYDVRVSELPLSAKIIGVADGLDNYIRSAVKSSGTIRSAVDMLKQGSGTAYSPEIVEVVEYIYHNEREILTGILMSHE